MQAAHILALSLMPFFIWNRLDKCAKERGCVRYTSVDSRPERDQLNETISTKT